jgi:hypothetical protein
LERKVQQLADRLPKRRAADALSAVGFRSLVLHEGVVQPWLQKIARRMIYMEGCCR